MAYITRVCIRFGSLNREEDHDGRDRVSWNHFRTAVAHALSPIRLSGAYFWRARLYGHFVSEWK
jgi:hypothetical protein